MAAGAGSTAAGWAQPLGVDCEVYTQVAALPAATFYVGVLLRCDSIANVSGRSRYDVRVTPSTSTWQLNRIVGGAATQIGSFTQALAAGDWIGLQAIGSAISVQWSSDGVAWTELGTVGDGVIVASGYGGVLTNDTGGATRWDNFGAGSLASPRSPHRMPMGV